MSQPCFCERQYIYSKLSMYMINVYGQTTFLRKYRNMRKYRKLTWGNTENTTQVMLSFLGPKNLGLHSAGWTETELLYKFVCFGQLPVFKSDLNITSNPQVDHMGPCAPCRKLHNIQQRASYDNSTEKSIELYNLK